MPKILSSEVVEANTQAIIRTASWRFGQFSIQCTHGWFLLGILSGRTTIISPYQVGVQKMLVKEITGHGDDAVDCSQITSKKQTQEMCLIVEKTTIITMRKIISNFE